MVDSDHLVLVIVASLKEEIYSKYLHYRQAAIQRKVLALMNVRSSAHWFSWLVVFSTCASLFDDVDFDD